MVKLVHKHHKLVDKHTYAHLLKRVWETICLGQGPMDIKTNVTDKEKHSKTDIVSQITQSMQSDSNYAFYYNV